METIDTQIAIVGGGPAGLLLSKMLVESGIEHVVIESRSHDEIATTQRAGILEATAVDALVAVGADRVMRDGDRHDGVGLRFSGETHRVDFDALTGRAVYLYPQTEVFKDLAALAAAAGTDVRWETEVLSVDDAVDGPVVLRARAAAGDELEVRARLVVGADGSRSVVRHSFPESVRRTHAFEYPYAWFGVIVEAPRSAPELIYADSDRGFALISQRNTDHQRMYFQCPPEENADDWSSDQIWDELQQRVAGADGFELTEGPVVEKTVLRFRSSVVDPVRLGRMVLIGDAAHTVPPTGAKGLNLAIADAVIMHDVLERWAKSEDLALLDDYGRRAGDRVWRAQHFSWWMSRMLHTMEGETPFERDRRRAELRMVTGSEAGMRFLAEGYTGTFPGLVG